MNDFTARPVTVTADPQTKAYANTDPALTYKVTGGSQVTGDSVTGSLTRVSGQQARTYAIQQATLAPSTTATRTRC